MKRRTFVTGVITAGAGLAVADTMLAQAEAGTTTLMSEGHELTQTAPETGYAPVNGLQMYYEIHGAGEPLVLLHGAYGTISMWGLFLESLSQHHQVIAVELQAHGHTADIDRPIRYEDMADDVAGLMKHLSLAKADVAGFSMGGNVALQLAMRHPDMVRKLVTISANYRADGYYPEVLVGIKEITPEVFVGSPMETAYLEAAPNPENWPVLIEKLKDLGADSHAWPDEEVAMITAPTLIMMGDADVMRPEHGVALFRLLGGGVPGDLTGLPNSQLAILPGTTHVTVTEQTDLLLSMIEAFLDAPIPEVG